MKRLKKSLYELYDLMRKVSSEDDVTTCAVLFYDDVITLMIYILLNSDVKLGLVDIHGTIRDYDKEYYVTLYPDMVVDIYPAYVKNRYVECDADVVFNDDRAKAQISFVNDNALQYEVEILRDDEKNYNDSSLKIQVVPSNTVSAVLNYAYRLFGKFF